jgi:hypothetical protein
MNRWNDLTEQEKQIVYDFIVQRKKLCGVACDLGLSVTHTSYRLAIIYRILGVGDQAGLALWVGRNWDLVNQTGKLKVVKTG